MLLLFIAIAIVGVWIYLLVDRGFFWRADIAPPTSDRLGTTPEIAIIVPARNEAETIGRAVATLLAQNYTGIFRLYIVDDDSNDGTGPLANSAALKSSASDKFSLLKAEPRPPGWTGKLWALQHGITAAAKAQPGLRYILFTDADIEHAPGILAELVVRAEAEGLDLASLMALLRAKTVVEQFLIPAFVYFFALLYPFRWVDDKTKATAAAAGGVMLVRRSALEKIGGLEAIKSALIDDCALAGKLKQNGRIWLGLTTEARSLRDYSSALEIWRMIARTAFTELDLSWVKLAVAAFGLNMVFVLPVLLTYFADGAVGLLGFAAWLIMSFSYISYLRLYRVTPIVAPLLPLVALFYLGATIDSALQHKNGKGGLWKGRIQAN